MRTALLMSAFVLALSALLADALQQGTATGWPGWPVIDLEYHRPRVREVRVVRPNAERTAAWETSLTEILRGAR